MWYEHYFAALTDTIITFASAGGYAALFAIIFLEGFPLIGIALPGHVAVIVGGFLAATGVFNIYEAILWTFLAAVLGDAFSYYLGTKYGWPLIERMRPYFLVKESMIAKARNFLDSHTKKALFFGRFNPITRGLIPFFVGANHMPKKNFIIINTLGSIAWVVTSMGAGYLLGLGYESAQGWLSKVAAVTIVMIGLTLWGYRFVNVRFHVFRKYELFALALNILSVIILFRMVSDAFSEYPSLLNFDIWVNNLVSYILETGYTWSLTNTSLWVGILGGTVAITVLAVILGLYFALKKKWRSAAITLVSIGFTAFSVAWLKELVSRVRPENFITPDVTNSFLLAMDSTLNTLELSFPSGHAAFSAAFFVTLVYLFTPKIHSWILRELFIVFCVGMIIVIGLSRLILSVHWSSDVVAGWALGVFCTTATILLVRYIGALIAGKIQS